MPRVKYELVDRIAARNAAGATVFIDVLREFTESTALGRAPEWLPGMLVYRVAGASRVTQLEDGSFELLPSKKRVRPI